MAGLWAPSHAHTGLGPGRLSPAWQCPHTDTAAAAPQAWNPGSRPLSRRGSGALPWAGNTCSDGRAEELGFSPESAVSCEASSKLLCLSGPLCLSLDGSPAQQAFTGELLRLLRPGGCPPVPLCPLCLRDQVFQHQEGGGPGSGSSQSQLSHTLPGGGARTMQELGSLPPREPLPRELP